MPKKRPQLGNLPPLYNFFLNPYSDLRFSRCPQCDGKTGQKKVPLMIHVDPHYPINLNYTCRYCAKCDLLIAHQDEIESHLAQVFTKLAPDAIGHGSHPTLRRLSRSITCRHAAWRPGR